MFCSTFAPGLCDLHSLSLHSIAPPLTVTDEELHKAIRLLDESFTAVLQDMSAAERDSEAAEEPRPAAIS